VTFSVTRQETLSSEVRRSAEHASILLAGELDLSTVGDLYAQFAELAREGVSHVALDLTELTFMDSSGLAVLIAEQKRVESLGGEMIVLSPGKRIRRLFELTGLGAYLTIRPEKVLEDTEPNGAAAPPE
jgi:anti-sigma B factor antagonist